MSRTTKTVVNAAPTSTTNITGFFISVTGFSLANEATVARRTISGSNNGRARTSFFGSSEVASAWDACTGMGGSLVVVDMANSRAAE